MCHHENFTLTSFLTRKWPMNLLCCQATRTCCRVTQHGVVCWSITRVVARLWKRASLCARHHILAARRCYRWWLSYLCVDCHTCVMIVIPAYWLSYLCDDCHTCVMTVIPAYWLSYPCVNCHTCVLSVKSCDRHCHLLHIIITSRHCYTLTLARKLIYCCKLCDVNLPFKSQLNRIVIVCLQTV